MDILNIIQTVANLLLLCILWSIGLWFLWNLFVTDAFRLPKIGYFNMAGITMLIISISRLIKFSVEM